MNPAVAIGALSAGASLFGGLMANDRNEFMNRENREFQEYMSSTAYQRAVVDMKAAGLNPMLAYSKGGASTPSGSVGQAHDPVTPAVNSGMAATRTRQELDNMKATEKATNAQEIKALNDADLSAAQAENVRADTLTKRLMPMLVEAQTGHYNNSASHLAEQVRELQYRIKEILPQEKYERMNLAGLHFANTSRAQTEIALNKAELEKVLPLIIRMKTLQGQLLGYQLPEAKAMAQSWSTGFGEHIRPYLGDVGKVIGSAAGVFGLGVGARGLASGVGDMFRYRSHFPVNRQFRHE